MKTLGTLISVGLAVLLAGTAVAEEPVTEQEHLTIAASGNFRAALWTAEDLVPSRAPTAAGTPATDPLAGLTQRLNRDLEQRLEQKLDLTLELEN